MAAYHDSSATLASLAVNGDHVVLVKGQKTSDILAKIVDEYERRWVVIIEPELVRHFEEVLVIIGAFSAQIVNFVAQRVSLSEESLYLAHVVPVNALHTSRWEAHRYYVFSYV